MFRPSTTCLDDSSVNPKTFLRLPTATRISPCKWVIDVRNMNYIFLWLGTTALRRYSLRRLAAAILLSHTGNRPHQRGYRCGKWLTVSLPTFIPRRESSPSCRQSSPVPPATVSPPFPWRRTAHRHRWSAGASMSWPRRGASESRI